MPKYVLTGCDGNLGSVAASYALSLAKPGDEMVFTSHRPGFIHYDLMREWQAKGAKILMVDYGDPANLKRAFHGAEAVSFISTRLTGKARRQQHKNVIDAAKAAGVKRICYTSFVGADLADKAGGTYEDIPFPPRDHAYTERLIQESGLEFCIQRNYLYMDNIPQVLAPTWKFCGDKWLCNSAGNKGAFVAREDCGRVLGALVMGEGEPNTVYTVTGPEAVTNEEIFEWMSTQSGYKGQFVEWSDNELEKWWADRGLPYDIHGDFSRLPCKLCLYDLLGYGQVVAQGHMSETTDTVERLTGCKAHPFKEALVQYKNIFPKSE